MKKFSAVFFSFAVTGCALIPKETEAGKAVKTVMADVPADCKELGSVDWLGSSWQTLSEVKLALKEKTAALGGNVLRLENVTQNKSVVGVGTAFKCPSPQ